MEAEGITLLEEVNNTLVQEVAALKRADRCRPQANI